MGARYILALVLMIGIMVIWSQIYPRLFAPELTEPGTSEQKSDDTTAIPESDNNKEDSPDQDLPITLQDSPNDPTVLVRTKTYEITFNERLAIAKKWELVEKKDNGEYRFPDRSTAGEPLPINLIPETALNCLALRFGNRNIGLDLLNATWEVDNEQGIDLTDNQKQEDTITFSTKIGEQLSVEKEFTFYREGYSADLKLKFKNESATEILRLGGNDSLNGYELRWGRGINADLLDYEKDTGRRGRRSTEGAKAYIGSGKPMRELKDEIASAKVYWAGLSSQYFSAIMVPDPKLNATYRLLDDENTRQEENIEVTAPTEIAVLRIPDFSLEAQKDREDVFRLFVGPKDDALLKEITPPNASDTQLGLTKIIDFGFFGPVALAMRWVLNGLYSAFRNYGAAIILLTLLVKVLSFPLTRKAHVSMKKMQQLQPQLTELREKYRDDPQKFNKASMRIYKENGVNPLSGCIPWLPQLPIFWALFALLGSAIELRGAPFFLWINDLSAPDTLYKLPFSIPIILPAFGTIDAIRFLPILNGVTTMLQQKFVGGMSPTPATSNFQTKLMKFMPLIFVFIFYNWASGFVLYWLCNNIFTVGQQYIQTKFFHDIEPDIPENTAKRKSK